MDAFVPISLEGWQDCLVLDLGRIRNRVCCDLCNWNWVFEESGAAVCNGLHVEPVVLYWCFFDHGLAWRAALVCSKRATLKSGVSSLYALLKHSWLERHVGRLGTGEQCC